MRNAPLIISGAFHARVSKCVKWCFPFTRNALWWPVDTRSFASPKARRRNACQQVFWKQKKKQQVLVPFNGPIGNIKSERAPAVALWLPKGFLHRMQNAHSSKPKGQKVFYLLTHPISFWKSKQACKQKTTCK